MFSCNLWYDKEYKYVETVNVTSIEWWVIHLYECMKLFVDPLCCKELTATCFYLSWITLVIWDWIVWFCAVQSLSGHTSPIESVAFDSAEVLVLAGASSGVIKLWDLEETKSKSIYLFSSIYSIKWILALLLKNCSESARNTF